MKKVADIIFDNNKINVIGELDFTNVMAIYNKSLSFLANQSDFIFDFSQLKSSNSAGLALIIEWIKLANALHKTIHFENLSKDLLAIAKTAGMDSLIS